MKFPIQIESNYTVYQLNEKHAYMHMPMYNVYISFTLYFAISLKKPLKFLA